MLRHRLRTTTAATTPTYSLPRHWGEQLRGSRARSRRIRPPDCWGRVTRFNARATHPCPAPSPSKRLLRLWRLTGLTKTGLWFRVMAVISKLGRRTQPLEKREDNGEPRSPANRSAIIALLWCCVATLLHGCSNYSYNNVTYSTREEAMTAARADLAAIRASIHPSGSPLRSTATVLIPDRRRIRERGIVTTGAVRNDQLEYIAEVMYLGYWVMGDALDASETFRSVELLESPDPQETARTVDKSDFVIWLHLQDQNTAQWYLRRAGSTDVLPLPVNTGVDYRQRAATWARLVKSTAAELEGSQTRGRTLKPVGGERSRLEVVSGGSAFAVAEGGYFMSNHHVVSGCERVTTFRDGEEHDVTVVHTDSTNDLVALKIRDIKVRPAVFAPDTPPLGSEVLAAGFPLRGLLSTQASVSVGVISNLSGPGNDARILQISAPVQPGNSGGPLLDEYGRVVGVVTATLDALQVASQTGGLPQNINFAMKGSAARDLLTSAGIRYSTGSSQQKPLTTAAISKIGQRITVPIDCWQ